MGYMSTLMGNPGGFKPPVPLGVVDSSGFDNFYLVGRQSNKVFHMAVEITSEDGIIVHEKAPQNFCIDSSVHIWVYY